MDNEEKEEYPGEFKDNLIKIAILIPALVFDGLYFFYDDNDLFFWIFLALMFIELAIFQFFRKKKK